MRERRGRWSVSALACVALCVAVIDAARQDYEPRVGQAGKDVVWVPTPQALVDRMLDMARVTAADYVIDLGSGDGRTVIAAARRGARALGIEYNPDMVELSRRNARAAGVAGASFARADIFESDLSQATVITMFLLPELNLRLRPALLALKPGTRLVSNSFTMGDWRPDETTNVAADTCASFCTAYLWIVPARVEGRWRIGTRVLTVTQSFQMLSGALDSVTISDARMSGDAIGFSVGDTRYSGRATDSRMEGTMAGQQTGPWTAVRE